MKPYAKEYMLMDSIIQDARDMAKLQLLGSAEENVHYAQGVVDQVRGLGHKVKRGLLYVTVLKLYISN